MASENQEWADTKQDRERAFLQCLDGTSTALRSISKSGYAEGFVAFPEKIGCDLGGGDWNVYARMITSWAEHNRRVAVLIFNHVVSV